MEKLNSMLPRFLILVILSAIVNLSVLGFSTYFRLKNNKVLYFYYFYFTMNHENKAKDAAWEHSETMSLYPPPGGHLGIFWVGMCRPGLQIGTPF